MGSDVSTPQQTPVSEAPGSMVDPEQNMPEPKQAPGESADNTSDENPAAKSAKPFQTSADLSLARQSTTIDPDVASGIDDLTLTFSAFTLSPGHRLQAYILQPKFSFEQSSLFQRYIRWTIEIDAIPMDENAIITHINCITPFYNVFSTLAELPPYQFIPIQDRVLRSGGELVSVYPGKVKEEHTEMGIALVNTVMFVIRIPIKQDNDTNPTSQGLFPVAKPGAVFGPSAPGPLQRQGVAAHSSGAKACEDLTFYKEPYAGGVDEFDSIMSSEQYRNANISHEELRLADYKAGLKGPVAEPTNVPVASSQAEPASTDPAVSSQASGRSTSLVSSGHKSDPSSSGPAHRELTEGEKLFAKKFKVLSSKPTIASFPTGSSAPPGESNAPRGLWGASSSLPQTSSKPFDFAAAANTASGNPTEAKPSTQLFGKKAKVTQPIHPFAPHASSTPSGFVFGKAAPSSSLASQSRIPNPFRDRKTTQNNHKPSETGMPESSKSGEQSEMPSAATRPSTPPPWACKHCGESLVFHPAAEQDAQICDICKGLEDTKCWLCVKRIQAGATAVVKIDDIAKEDTDAGDAVDKGKKGGKGKKNKRK